MKVIELKITEFEYRGMTSLIALSAFLVHKTNDSVTEHSAKSEKLLIETLKQEIM